MGQRKANSIYINHNVRLKYYNSIAFHLNIYKLFLHPVYFFYMKVETIFVILQPLQRIIGTDPGREIVIFDSQY